MYEKAIAFKVCLLKVDVWTEDDWGVNWAEQHAEACRLFVKLPNCIFFFFNKDEYE